MPHKRVSKDVLESVEERISRAKASIQRIRDLTSFNRDSKELFVSWLKDCAEVAGEQRDTIQMKLGLGKVGPDIQHAITWAAAQANAYKNVLDVLTEPEKIIDHYEDDIRTLELERKSYESFEQPR